MVQVLNLPDGNARQVEDAQLRPRGGSLEAPEHLDGVREMPAASRRFRAALAFSRRFETLKRLCCSRRSTSASAVPRVLIERTRS